MNYETALQDARTQYAIATGRVDERNQAEVIQFLEGVMRKTSQTPEHGYVVIDNGYGNFSRKIENGIEAAKECDLESVLDLIDQGLLKKSGMNRAKGATYYVPARTTLKEMESLLTETGELLNDAIQEYERRMRKHTGTMEMKKSVAHLKRRFATQTATVRFLHNHQ